MDYYCAYIGINLCPSQKKITTKNRNYKEENVILSLHNNDQFNNYYPGTSVKGSTTNNTKSYRDYKSTIPI